MLRLFLAVTLLAGLTACATSAPAAPSGERRAFAVELEGGVLWQTRNDVAVPGDDGTRFALDELTGSGPFPAARLYATWSPAERHELRLLLAPLSVSGEGELDEEVSFAGETFAPGVPTDATYRFDSYRLTYRYLFHDGERWDWRVGVTAKLRDAEIELEQGGTSASKTDTGFVPLLHVAGDWHFAPGWRMSLDLDGAASPQGRAFDLALKGYWTIREGLDLGLGYRTVEGGADNDEVYTFSWFQQVVVSLRWAF
jgi:hypothetical protein